MNTMNDNILITDVTGLALGKITLTDAAKRYVEEKAVGLGQSVMLSPIIRKEPDGKCEILGFTLSPIQATPAPAKFGSDMIT